MKFHIVRENLIKALTPVVPAAHLKSLPVLRNVRLEVVDDELHLAATNLEIGAETVASIMAEEQGATTVEARELMRIAKSIPKGSLVTIEGDDRRVTVSSAGLSRSLEAISAEDFPITPSKIELPKPVTFHVASNVLRDALTETTFAMGRDSARPVLDGMHLSVVEGQATVAAADNYRVSFQTLPLLPSRKLTTASIIIRSAGVDHVLRYLLTTGEEPVEVTISTQRNQIRFVLGNLIVVSGLVDGIYPNFQQVIPPSHPTWVTVAKDAFISAMKTAAQASPANWVGLVIGPDALWAVVTDNENVLFRSKLDVLDFTGDRQKIAANPGYLADLVNLKGDTLKIGVSNSLSPMTALSGSKATVVVMPQRITTDYDAPEA